MAIDVVVLPRGGTEPFRAWHELQQSEVVEEEWAESAIELSRQSARGNPISAEVFICLLGDHLTDRYDHWYFEKLLNVAHKYSWGGKIFIAIDNRIGIQEGHLSYDSPSLNRWFDVIHRMEVTSVVEVPFDREGTIPLDPNELRKAADADVDRQDKLDELNGGTWFCVPANTSRRLIQFLYPFTGRNIGRPSGSKYVLVVERSEGARQVSFVKSMMKRDTAGQYAVAALTVRPSIRLQDYCRDNGLPVLWFRGPFELRYFLLRLNSHSGTSASPAWGTIEPVQAHEPRVFPARVEHQPAGLLVTSAFDPHTEPGQVLKASEELRAIVRDLPKGVPINVQRTIAHCDLPTVISSLPALTVWLHVGHGQGLDGLQDFKTGRFVLPQKWLDCFIEYGARGNGLGLVFFSACQSTQIAHMFAAAGAGVTVGFEREVHPDATKILAASVVREALVARGDRSRILNAFNDGCTRLASNGLVDAGPVAFYSK